MKAVITTGGKQYYVSEGDVIYVEKLDLEEGAKVDFEQVLMVDNKVGTPYLDGAKVTGTVLKNGKQKKIVVYKYNPTAENGQEIPPDVKYFENDILKSYERYSAVSGTYTQHYYFDNGISIKTWYVDNKKVREIIYQDDKVMRSSKIDEEKHHPEH